jgi:hypothetical protein
MPYDQASRREPSDLPATRAGEDEEQLAADRDAATRTSAMLIDQHFAAQDRGQAASASAANSTPPSVRQWKLRDMCQRHTLVVPDSYGKLVDAIEQWVAHCVQSRTKVRGRAVHRERSVVARSQRWLQQLWLQRLEQMKGQRVTLLADWDGSPYRPESVRLRLLESTATFDGEDFTSKRPSPSTTNMTRDFERWLSEKHTYLQPVPAHRLQCIMRLMQSSSVDDEYISNHHLAAFLDQGQDFADQIDHVKPTLQRLAPYWRNGEKQTVIQQLLALDKTIFAANKRLKKMATYDSTTAMGRRFKKARDWVLAKHANKNSIYSCFPL